LAVAKIRLSWVGVVVQVCNPSYLGGSEIRVLDLRSKILEFHMPGLATCPYVPNKGALMVKGREKGD
jgi:hypothetical protein